MKPKLPIKKSDNVFVQSNEFIQAKYKDNMTFWELVIFAKMCSMIDPNDTDFKDYKIYIKDLIDFTGVVKGGVVYQYVLEASERLKQREINVTIKNDEGKEEILDTYLVVGRKILKHKEEDESMYIKLTFHPDLRPFLLQLKRDFTKFDIRSYKFLHTSTSIRLYHILKQYYGRNKLHPKLELQELKDMLGVGEKYNPYNNFKQRVLEEAQRRLGESTDIRFTYDETKIGKKVVGLVFHIEENQASWLKNDNATIDAESEEVPQTVFNELFPKVEKWGVSREVLNLLIDTQPEEALRTGIAYTLHEEKQGKIKDNKAGFFINAVKNRYTSPSFEAEQKRLFKITEAKQKTAQLTQWQNELKAVNENYQTALNDVIRQLTADNPDITNRAIEGIKIENKGYFALKGVNIDDLSIDDFRQDKILRGMVIQQIQVRHAESFTEVNSQFLPLIKDLETRIKDLKKN